MAEHPGIAVMLAMKKKKDEGAPPGAPPEEGAPPMEGPGGGDPLRIAAEDLIDSVHAGDVEGVMAALQNAFETCSMPEEEGEGESKGEEGGEE